MRATKRPIYQGNWRIDVQIMIMEVSACQEIRALASPFGSTEISLVTPPYFLDGNSEAPKLINSSPVSREIQRYGPPGVRSIVGYSIDQAALKPGEEQFLAFYLRSIVPACIGSDQKGQQKVLRQSCIQALFADKELVDFIRNVILPGEDITKPTPITKMFNNTFSVRTIELDLENMRKGGMVT